MHFKKLAEHYIDLARKPVGTNDFAGADVRYTAEFEMLESELGKSAALHETTTIDWQKVLEGCEALLAQQSKDLRVAAWLGWALYQRESHAGLQAGLAMLSQLCNHHWADLHPRKARTRAAALAWLLPRMEQALAVQVPVGEQLPLFRALADHLRQLDDCLTSHLGEEAPLFLPLRRRLDELVERASQGHPEAGPVGAAIAQVKQVATQIINPTGVVENSKDAQRNLRNLQDQARPLCTWWLKQKAGDQRALRLSRTLLWLPVDALPERNAERITALRGLPADKLDSYRERIKQGLYADLLLDLETSIARAPFWLDGQRMVWECLLELNDAQAMLEVEIQLALFLQRLPGLEELRFHDGSPFADAETRAWIDAHVRTHLQPPAPAPSHVLAEAGALPAWEEALQHAQAQIRTDGLKVAVQYLKQGLNRAQGGRERFFWQLVMARLCYQAKKYELAKTQLESLDQLLQASGLGAWEPDLALEVLHLLHSCCELLPQNHAVRERKDEIYRRLCHLDLEVVLE
ncbi:type VI secretion system protein VasJ [Geopseudomonas sagittaria]|uniref:Type VI secretion system protein VasJ n=1 Tax=Geopseudomonas sagittaria TaxID=1135990 RepID=A0A1I5PV02_9GAMM|nr:type VI secretion system protein TssA [Pseudomonas sagittaria]MCM2330021.1 type VI secretion system protein TssA [Pseudomonas sagittaria]SFP37680.1 type VI secretion system protein VasJ [Pseudomonas sagittaria]